MSDNRFSKHQKSRKPRFVLTDPDGKVILQTNKVAEFEEKQDELSEPARARKLQERKDARLRR